MGKIWDGTKQVRIKNIGAKKTNVSFGIKVPPIKDYTNILYIITS